MTCSDAVGPLPQEWDIWLVKCKFIDRKGYKFRPMVIVSADNEMQEYLAIKITSSTTLKLEGDYVLADWEYEGLLKPSIVRTSQIFRITADDFGDRAFPLGYMSSYDASAICGLLNIS